MNVTARQTWTPLSLISWGTEYLQQKGIESPRFTIELLLGHVLKCKRIDLYVNFEKPVTNNELAFLKELIQRRVRHEPLQYILGGTEFMGLPIVVRPGVLIPRRRQSCLSKKC